MTFKESKVAPISVKNEIMLSKPIKNVKSPKIEA